MYKAQGHQDFSVYTCSSNLLILALWLSILFYAKDSQVCNFSSDLLRLSCLFNKSTWILIDNNQTELMNFHYRPVFLVKANDTTILPEFISFSFPHTLHQSTMRSILKQSPIQFTSHPQTYVSLRIIKKNTGNRCSRNSIYSPKKTESKCVWKTSTDDCLEAPQMQSWKRIKSLTKQSIRSYEKVESPFRSNCTP